MAEEPAKKDDAKEKSGGLVTKVVAGVFGAVIAPITVTVGIQWANKLHTPDKPDPAPSAAADTKPPSGKDPGPSGTPPKTPTFGVVNLITPNLADHFYQYGWNEELQKDTRTDAIDPAIFRPEAKPDRIIVTGGSRGYSLNTKDEHEDYTLHFWYRFGEKAYQWPKDPPEGFPRTCSIGIHVTGPDGAVKRTNSQNIAVRLGEGQAGTLNLVGVPGSIEGKAKVVESPDKRRRVYSPDVPAVPVSVPEGDGWYFLIMRRDYGDLPDDKAGYKAQGIGRGWRPEGDPLLKIAPPYGPDDWNRVKIVCHGTSIKVIINNRVMNEITDLNVHRGRIGIACQGSDFEVGRLELEMKPPPKPAATPAEKKQP